MLCLVIFVEGYGLCEFFNFVVFICCVFEVLYEVGIIYCDFKLLNFFVIFCGDVKLFDFGIVQYVEVFFENMMLMQIGIFVGMVFYMLLEQIVGEVLMQCLDFFVFGIFFFEMLMGEWFFVGCIVGMVCLVILNDLLFGVLCECFGLFCVFVEIIYVCFD